MATSLKARDQKQAEEFFKGGPVRVGDDPKFAYREFKVGQKTIKKPCLALPIEWQDEDGNVQEYELRLKTGDKFTPSEDGENPSDEGPYLIGPKDASIHEKCGFAVFSRTREDAGKDPLESTTELAGEMYDLEFNVQGTVGKGANEQEYSQYEVGKILDEVPWSDEAPAKKGKRRKSKSKLAPEPEPTEELEEKCVEVLKTALKGNKKGLAIKGVRKAAYTAIEKSHKGYLDDRSEIVDRLEDETFYSDHSDEFEFDGDSATIKAA